MENLGVTIVFKNYLIGVKSTPRIEICFYYISKSPRCEASENIIFHYANVLGVGYNLSGYGHHGKKRPVDKIMHKNKDSDVRCDFIIEYFTPHDLFCLIYICSANSEQKKHRK